MSTTMRRLSEAEPAERRRRERERLQAAEPAADLRGLAAPGARALQAGLARLSFSNQLLGALTRPDARFVAGFTTSLRLGFAVKEGERASESRLLQGDVWPPLDARCDPVPPGQPFGPAGAR